MAPLTERLARRAAERSLAGRHAAYADDIARIVDATYAVIERTGTVDPPLREILAEARIATQGFYRYFGSKDELLLLLLDDGRRQLHGYLLHRMEQTGSAEGRVRAWITGWLAQATDPAAAARTRPFFASEDRLAERFPEEHGASVDLLVGLLVTALRDLPGAGRAAAVRRDAEAIYRLTAATTHAHLRAGTRPTPAAAEHLVRFCLAGATSAGRVKA